MNRFRRFIASLPAGDKAIAGALSVCVVLACASGLAALIRHYQVVVPAYGGTLTEGVVGSPRFDNPLLANSDADRTLTELTFAGLMGHDSKGALVPVLAESYTVSPSGTVYTFTLRKGVEFSDGTPVTADDVAFTIQKAQDPALKSPEYSNWSNVRAEAVDARTIRFTLPKPYAPFLEDATLGILPKHVWQNVSDEQFAFSSYNTNAIGAGPYVVSSVGVAADGTITSYSLSSFRKFALGRPYISHIRLSFFATQNELTTAYENGTVKAAYGDAKQGALSVPYARVFAVFFNADQNAALKNLGVRKALSFAIDRTTLTKQALGGYATPLNGPLPAGTDVPAVPLPNDATRLQDARDALTSAGYKYDDSAHTWSKAGTTLTMTITTSNVPELKVVAGQVQKDWQSLGVPTEIEFQDPSSLAQSVIRPRNYGALLFGEVVGTQPDLYAFWSSTERDAPGLNIANYSNTDVDTLLSQARTQSDPTTRNATLAQIQEKIAADYPAAFLYTPDFVYDAQPGIQGIHLTSLSSPADRFWGIWSWYRYTEHVWPIFVHARKSGA